MTQTEPKSFKEVVDCWPNQTAMAQDCGVELPVVQQWRIRSNIPARHWTTVVAKAAERNIVGVTFELLSRLAARQDSGSKRRA